MYKDYASLKQFVLDGRSKTQRKIENNTIVKLLDNEVIIIQLHDTDIMKFSPFGAIALNSGGYKTQTTKSRINEYLPEFWKLSQDKGLWIISHIPHWNWQNKSDYLFVDYMIINPDNTVLGTGLNNQKQLLKLREQIKKYAKNFMIALASGKVEKPNGGDCWDCVMREVNTHVPLGELRKDTEHLLLHMKEKYYVGSLFYRAVELYPMSLYSNSVLYELWENGRKLTEWDKNIFMEQGYKSLLKYLYSQFNLPY